MAKRNDMLGEKNPAKRPEVREKIRKKMLGRKITWGNKISAGKKGGKMSREAVLKSMKTIKRLYPNGIGCCKKGKENYVHINGNPFKDKKHTEETKKRISIANSGINSGTWRGGISNDPYDFEFNKELKFGIKLRDNNTCQYCGQIDDLVVHHIDYNKMNSDPNNLITLCRSCHTKTNTRRAHFTNFFKDYRKKKRSTISYGDFELRCKKMAKEILKLKNIKNLYGIPRAGMLIAIRISYLTGLPIALSPDKDTVVIDDISDFGKTRHSFGRYRYFYTLVDKEKEEMKEWIRFWWEEGAFKDEK